MLLLCKKNKTLCKKTPFGSLTNQLLFPISLGFLCNTDMSSKNPNFGEKKIPNFCRRRKEGPSGKPMKHFQLLRSRKQAEDAARAAGSGPPIRHPAHEPGQHPHYHPAKKDGSIIKDGSHYQYPDNSKQFFNKKETK